MLRTHSGAAAESEIYLKAVHMFFFNYQDSTNHVGLCGLWLAASNRLVFFFEKNYYQPFIPFLRIPVTNTGISIGMLIYI